MAEDTFGGSAPFPSTRWSLVHRAGRKSGEARREALNHLLIRYLPALQAHLRAKWGLSSDRAADLLQDFVSDKILQQNLIARANQDKGRFRNLLLKSLHNYVVSVIRRKRARKRVPDEARLTNFDGGPGAVAATPEPAEAFDVAWAREVVAESLRRMESICRESDRLGLWEVFECRVAAPILAGEKPPPYQELVDRFGFQSPTQAANTVLTGKRMFARTLRSVVGEYARDAQEVESEIADLKKILSESRAKPAHGMRSGQ